MDVIWIEIVIDLEMGRSCVGTWFVCWSSVCDGVRKERENNMLKEHRLLRYE